jgi:hypothetical protein
VKQASLVEASAAMQSRLSRMIRDLSCSTAGTGRPPSLPEMRERLGDVRERLEATLDKVQNSAARPAPISQAASPQVHAPAAQDEGQPESARKASDDRSVGVSGKGTADQSEELRHVAGAGGESAASADTAPAADEKKPKRTFPQPLPAEAPVLPLARPSAEIHKQPDYKASGPSDPMVPRREPHVLRAGGGLVQDGGSKTDAPPRPAQDKPAAATGPLMRDRVLDDYARTGETADQIAKRLGTTTGSVYGNISHGRTKKDSRVAAGDAKRAAAVREANGKAYDASQKPAAEPTAKTSLPAPTPKPVEAAMPDGLLIRVKSIDGEVHGPLGVWRTTPEISKAIGSLATGDLYGITKMAGPSGLPEKTILASLDLWKTCLAKIGIDLIHTRGIGVKLNRRAA